MTEPHFTILHIEDNEANRYVVSRILRNAGFSVVEAITGEAGLQAVAAHQPDLIILDVKLPGMSGFEVCRQIKSNLETTFIPVLHLSASFVKGQDKAEGLDSGADAYLAQPVEPIELLATVRSLLRIRQAEEAALSLAREWQTSFDSITDAIGLLDQEGKFLRCNQALSQLFDQFCSDMVASRHQDVMQRAFGIGDGNCFRQAKASCRREHYEFQANGRWFLKTIDPVLDEKGCFTGAVFILTDITERKLAEAALQERNQRLDLLYKTTRDLLSSDQPLTLIDSLFQKLKDPLELDVYLNYLVDPDHNQLHLATYGGICESVAQEIEWLEYGQAICGTVAQQHHQIVCAGIQDSQDPAAELTRSLGITAYSCQPLIAQGQLFGTLAFGSCRRTQFTSAETDLMQALCDQMAIALDRSRLLSSLQNQTDELRQANQIKDEFLAVLSHELRSPLNPILGWTHLLRTRSFDAAATDRALETIERNAKLQTQLIEDLLDISRILRGKMALNVAPVDLGQTIKAAIETVQLAAESKAIQIRLTVEQPPGDSQNLQPMHDGACPILVSGDAARLQQIIWNLLSNAVKFTPSGGQVEVRLARVMGDSSLETGKEHYQQPSTDYQLPVTEYAQITVSDTGKGINPEFLPHVFEYFRQEDSKTTRQFGGLGLGLAIVHYLTELHGGTVQAASSGENTGATFTLQLPLLRRSTIQQPASPSFPLTPSSLHPLTRLRILAVDDEADMRELLLTVLEQAGAVVKVAASAAETLEALDQFQPDILISDIGMPDIDGYMLIRQVREHLPELGRQIPAIALTAYARAEDQSQALQEGFQLHLAKPVDPNKLVVAIASLTGCVATNL